MAGVQDEAQDVSKPECIVVMGSTGLGKSSLIKAITGLDVHVSSGVQSDTKHAQMFRHSQTNRIFIDTTGAEDSEEKESDEHILRKVMHTIEREGANNIKIIWMAKKETRMTHNLQIQARFIQAFADSIEGSAWNSVMVVIKEGDNLVLQDQDETLDCQGALAAAAAFGARGCDKDGSLIADLPRVGYTCLDWLTGRRQEKKMDAARNQAYAHRFEDGLLFEQEVVEHVSNMLKQLLPMNIQFKKQKCRICGVEGDNRFVPVECHEKSFRVHPQVNNLIHLEETPGYKHPHALQYNHTASIVNYHSGATHNKHAGYLMYAHSGYTEYYHSSSASSYHSGSLRYRHTGSLSDYHPQSIHNTARLTGHYHPQGKRYSIHKMCNVYKCCNWKRGSQGCTPQYSMVTQYQCCQRPPSDPGCRTRYSCCGGASGSGGCSAGTYSCCGRATGSTGCTSQYSCCSRSSGSTGCQSRMSCCYGGVGSTGCNATYSCCGQSSSACTQTKYSCCENLVGTTGCKQKYSCCEKASGSSGCRATYVCCGKEPGSKGCQGEYTCCNQPVESSVAGCVYACCRQVVGAPECQEKCQRCHGVWGDSEGCTIRSDLLPYFHDMMDLEE